MKFSKIYLSIIIGFLLSISTSHSAFSIHGNVASGVTIKAPIRANIYQQLYFGEIAPSLTSVDIVKVRRGADNNSKCGDTLTCFEKGNRARMLVTGEPFKIFTTSNPGPVTLSDGQGATMLVDDWVGGGSNNNTSWGPTGHLNASGIRRQSFGATLHVGANQPVGTYTGSYTVQVEYQ